MGTTDPEGNSVEYGITPDVELVALKDDGTRDYSAFYDIDNLSKIMNGLASK